MGHVRSKGVLAVTALSLALAGCGTAPTIDKPQGGSAGKAPEAKGDCVAAAPGEANGKQWSAEPPLTIDTSASYTATLTTNCGTITVELDAAKAPRTVNSFVFLAGEDYFDHTDCHRLTTEGIFVLQCGDPTGSGMGGPGYEFADENLKGAVYPAGTLAMANAGPGTNGSQFFLVYKDAELPPNYTPFGRITGGMEHLESIAANGVEGGGADGSPAHEVVLEDVTTAH